MQRTDKQSGQIHYMVNKKVSDTEGLWSADARFAQICDESYDPWEFENDDRRGKVYNFTYELVEVDAEIYYIITDPRGWVVAKKAPNRFGSESVFSYSKTNCSVIDGKDYESIRQQFDQFGFERHKKVRIFPQ